MVYKLTDEHEMIRASAKELAEQEIAPLAEKIDEEDIFPREIIGKLAEYGFMGMTISEEYDGSGTDFLSHIIALEEIARASGTVATIMMIHNSLAAFLLNSYAPKEIKDEYLSALATGEKLASFALAELTGSKLDKLTTTAENKGNYYLVNGRKTWVTGASEADVYVVVAKEKESGKPIILVIDKDMEGVKFGITYKTMGLKGASIRDVILNNVQVPTEKVITGDVEKMIRRVLDAGRVATAAISIGLARIAIDEAVTYCNQRKQFGKLIGKFGALQDYIGDIASKTEAARQLVYHAASVIDDEYEFHMKSMMAKIFATEIGAFVTRKSILIHGGIAYTKDRPVERFARDARGLVHLWGKNDDLRAMVARNLLGYPETEEAPFRI